MERIIIKFDEAGYNREAERIKTIAGTLNNSISNLKEEFELDFLEPEIKELFIERQNPDKYINSLYVSIKPVKIRNGARQEVKEAIEEIQKTEEVYRNGFGVADFFTVKKNKIAIKEIALETLKNKFEVAIETERAKEAFELHQVAFDSLTKLESMAKENNKLINILSFFKYSREFKLEKTDINYNRI